MPAALSKKLTVAKEQHDSATPGPLCGDVRAAIVRRYTPGPPVPGAIAADAPVGADPEEWPSWLGGKLAALVDLITEGPVVVVTVRAPEIARELASRGVKVL